MWLCPLIQFSFSCFRPQAVAKFLHYFWIKTIRIIIMLVLYFLSASFFIFCCQLFLYYYVLICCSYDAPGAKEFIELVHPFWILLARQSANWSDTNLALCIFVDWKRSYGCQPKCALGWHRRTKRCNKHARSAVRLAHSISHFLIGIFLTGRPSVCWTRPWCCLWLCRASSRESGDPGAVNIIEVFNFYYICNDYRCANVWTTWNR